MKRLPSLDGFRAISIILVLIAHSRFSKGFPVKYGDLARHGAVGVTVFFVISGFLITYLLLAERSKVGHISLKRFYINRALRILPVFLLYTCVIICWNRYHYIGIEKSDIIH
ncbi:MAG: acyltransferase, partial [Bacteroidota bacterium]|nr:acyltransferase [Bacteroidota bacterium]